MSNKFIGLDDAADKLGISKDRLNELREAGELRAYRDGTSWKFRTEEIDELAAKGVSSADDDLTLDSDIGLAPPSDAPIDISDDDLALDPEDDDVLGIEPLGDGDDAESILLTNDQVDDDVARPPSTIIGKSEVSLEDDLSLSDDLQPEPIDVELSSESSNPSGSFDDLEELEIDLDAESSRLLDASDVAAAQAAASASAESIDGASLEIEEDLELELEGVDALSEGSDVMAVDEGTDELATSDGSSGSIAGLSGIDEIQLGEDEQDDLVLGDGSDDLSLATSDSGINLAPSDSGIALDEVPLDLGGSAIGSALDLASLSASIQESQKPSSEPSASGSDVTEGDEFLLTPISGEDSGEEDSSQVVALEGLDDDEAPEGSFAFSEVSDDDSAEGAIGFDAVEDDGLGGDFGGGIDSPSAEPVAASVSDEATFPGWIFGMLIFCMFSMSLCGLMALDLVNSMWSWSEPYDLSSSIMDQLIALGGN